MRPFRRRESGLALAVLALLCACAWRAGAEPSGPSGNAFGNASFELGREFWWIDYPAGTVGGFAVDNEDAAVGRYSALVTVGQVGDWGVQFGQPVDAVARGRTLTFAVFARNTKQPVTVALEVQRAGPPWDNAATKQFTLDGGEWRELHVTFRVPKAFPEGWYAYVYCGQPGAEFRVDMFRLYEGDYVPYSETAREQMMAAEVRVFDAAVAGDAPILVPESDDGTPWTRIGPGETGHEFAQDAIVLNGRVALVGRKGAPALEVYAASLEGYALRATLAPRADTSSGTLSLRAVVLDENDPQRAGVAAAFETVDGRRLTLQCELGMGEPFLKVTTAGGVSRLRLEAPSRFVVLPDFFADDIVVDAAALPVPLADLPCENFLMHMLGDGEAILIVLRRTADEDVRVTLSGEDRERVVTASEIHCDPQQSIWVGVMEGAGIWHVRDVTMAEAGRATRLDWRPPFKAQWRVDWTRRDGLVDSWEMATQKRDGGFVKHGWFGSPRNLPADRRRWTTVLGWFRYPCWIDHAGYGWLQPLEEAVQFEGPALIYPINRATDTPLDAYTVVDMARGTLGLGPCQYILDVEAQEAEYVGNGGCDTRDRLNAIYAKGDQRRRRGEIDQRLSGLLRFLKHIRGRIDAYVAFGREMLEYLAAQKRAHPELADTLTELETLTRAIDGKVAARQDAIQTPEYAENLIAQFRAEVLDYEGPDALERCKAISEAWVEVAGNQDELVGECRLAVRLLRQRAGLALTLDPRMADITAEIRERTRQMLRNPTVLEAPRH